MPLFECEKCHCIENTALCNYWSRDITGTGEKLCSSCDPHISEWHGKFPKKPVTETNYIKNVNTGYLEPPGGWK